MWHRLNPAEQAKFLAMVMLSVSLFTLAMALVYFAYTLSLANKTAPAILTQVESILNKVAPVLAEIEATRQSIPPILDEVAAVRSQIPPLLAEMAATREALPPLLDTTAKSIHEVNTTVKQLEPHIPEVLAEVRQTRESLPGLMTRAEKLVADAGKAGREASSGAVLGFFGGIITAPFKIIGGIGKGFANAIGLTKEKGFTDRDIELAEEATNTAIRKGEIGTATMWENPDTKNRGTVTLLKQRTHDELTCYVIQYQASAASGKTHESQTEICQDKNGNWTQRK